MVGSRKRIPSKSCCGWAIELLMSRAQNFLLHPYRGMTRRQGRKPESAESLKDLGKQRECWTLCAIQTKACTIHMGRRVDNRLSLSSQGARKVAQWNIVRMKKDYIKLLVNCAWREKMENTHFVTLCTWHRHVLPRRCAGRWCCPSRIFYLGKHGYKRVGAIFTTVTSARSRWTLVTTSTLYDLR